MAAIHTTRQLVARKSRQCFFRSLSTSSAPHADGYPSALPISALQSRPSQESRFQRPSAPQTPAELAKSLVASREPSSALVVARRQKADESLRRMEMIRDLERQNRRRWQSGNLYSPHDLSAVEMQKWTNKNQGARDVFDVLGINPIHEYKNVSILGDFLTPMGRIKHRKETGLRPVNQRKIAKAIRRAVAMGLLPSVHKHPEIMEVEEAARNERRFGKDGRSGIVRQ